MSYTYSYISDALSSGLLFGVFSGVPTTLIGIATYVLSALGLYTIAKRRGLNHPWLAWIPVASAWIVGSLSDQYRYVVNGENKSKRKVLLTLNIITTVLSLVMVACGIGMVAQALIGAAGGIDEANADSNGKDVDVIKNYTYDKNSGGTVGSVTFTNVKATKDWDIVKVSTSRNQIKLQGAEFELLKNNTPVYIGTSNDNEKII